MKNREMIDVDDETSHDIKLLLVKTGLGVGLSALGFLVVKRLIKGGKKNGETKAYQAPSLSTMTIDSSQLSLSPNDAKTISSNMYMAMDKVGTDNDIIYAELGKIKTKDDLLLVITQFGLRKYFGFGYDLIGRKTNLIGWLKNEFHTKKEVEKINGYLSVFGFRI